MDEAKIQILFKIYEKAFNELDTTTIARQYDDTFIGADPAGTTSFDRKEFIRRSRDAAGMYKSMGQNSARILSKKIIPISKEYALVTVHWGVTFEQTGDQLIEFDVSYIIQQVGEEMRIILFISHEDEEKKLKSLGLDPGRS